MSDGVQNSTSTSRRLSNSVILTTTPRIIYGNIEITSLNTIIRWEVGDLIELGGLSQSRDEQGSEIAVEIRSSR